MQQYYYAIILDDPEDNGGFYEERTNDETDNVDELPSSFDDMIIDNDNDSGYKRSNESGASDDIVNIIENAMTVSVEDATARALDEFNFLVGESNKIEGDESSSTVDNNIMKSSSSEKLGLGNLEIQSEWNVDASAIERLKEQYKKERKSKKVSKRETSS